MLLYVYLNKKCKMMCKNKKQKATDVLPSRTLPSKPHEYNSFILHMQEIN